MIPPVNVSSPPRAVSPLRWAYRALLWLLFLLWSLVVVAWLVLHWAILPHIQQWRPQIEERASRALGVAVNIGHIEVRSSGWVPALELRDVVLRDAQGRPALSLPRIATALSPHSLLALEPRLAQLLIEGAHLEVRRDTAGRIFVAGIDLSGPGGDDTAAADWLVRQQEIVIRGGSLRWTDERRNAAPLQLNDVQLVMRNGLRQHDLRLDATPPAEWGERFTLRGRFTQALLARAGDWQRWSGAVHAELPRADLRELRQYVGLPFELSEGIGALRAWIDLREGLPTGGTVDIALRSVALRLAANIAPLTLQQLQGRVVGRRTAEGLSIALHDFGFLAGDGSRWPAGDMSLSLRQRADEPSTGGQFSAQRLDLAVLAQVAASLPLGDALRGLVAEVKPRGDLSELAARWTGPLDAPAQYQVNAVLSGLALASRASSQPNSVGRPGLRNASVQLTANQAGGSAMLSVIDGAIELPGVFEEPLLPLDRLTANLAWKNDAGRIIVEVKDARFANPDAQGELSGSWKTGAGQGLARGGRFPGQIDLSGKLGNAVATRLARYLPLHIPEPTRRYVERAVKGGKLASVNVRVQGDLWDFPYFEDDSKGHFRIAAQAEDVSFAYVPSVPADAVHPAYESPWPMLRQVKGEIVLDRSSLLIRNVQAQLGQTQWSQLQGGIQNFTERPVLKLNSTGQGALTEMLRLVNVTPIGDWIHRSLAQATGTGPAEMKLNLAIPLQDLEATEVKGSVALAGNDVRITPASPMLESARGRVDFSHQGFAVVGATARAHGGDISFEGGAQADGTIRFNGQGNVSAEALRRAPEFGLLSRVASWLDGRTDYRMELGFVQGHPEIMVSSNLVGFSSTLPAPLAKAATAPLPMRYQTRIARESLAPGQALRDSLRLDLGSVVQAQYQRDISGEAPRVLRGGVGLMEAAPTPPRGVSASVNVASINVDAWQAIQDKMFESAGATAGAVAESGGYSPNVLNLRAKEMLFLSRRMNNVLALLTLDKGQWRANLDADQLDGYVEYRPPQPGAATGGITPGRVFARLSRLSLPPSEVDEVERLLDEQPTSVPNLDIVVSDFELRGKRLGRLEIEASNRIYNEGSQAVREWRLAKFNLLTPEARLTANGQWSLGAGGAKARRAVMDFRLALTDSGAYLERLGMGQVVRGGKGLISGHLAWLGSPLTIDYASLTGQANVEIESGQFLKADAGAARLLGVLSLQSLPRRLSLDFRDVFEEGFAFDSFTGDLRVDQGVAHTNNLRMRGAQAAALMEGQADLARETQDLRVVVVPEIDAGTASLAYAIINPAVGLGTFLAQMFLRKPFSQAGTREFHVRGPWADPSIDRVERRADSPPATTEGPEPSAPTTNLRR